MAPIQFILITLILLIGGVYLATLASRLITRLANLGLVGIGILFVLNPDLTTSIARRVGVGRGADLLLYLLCLGSTLMFLQLHRKNRELEEKLTEVARSVALQGARKPGEKS